MAPGWVTALTAIAIIFMWLTSMAVGSVTGNWAPLTITTPVMMVLAGFAFGVKIIRRQTNGD